MDLFGNPDPVIEDEAQEEDFQPARPAGPPAMAEESFDHPRRVFFCLGHERQEEILMRLWRSGRMPHGLVFAGPKGIGKATMAYRLARFVLSPRADKADAADMSLAADDHALRRIAQGAHPDFLGVERSFDEDKGREKGALDVEQTRKIGPFLYKTASEGGWRVVIVDDADTMNRNAQNAILKILEEPPPRCLLILIAHRPGALLPTIHSRSVRLNFTPLSEEAIDTILSRAQPSLSPLERRDLAHYANGAPGQALFDAQNKGYELRGAALSPLQETGAAGAVLAHRMADQIGMDASGASFEIFKDFALGILEDACRHRGGRDLPENLTGLAVIAALSEKLSLQALLERLEACQSLFERTVGANLDKRQAVLGAYSLLRSV